MIRPTWSSEILPGVDVRAFTQEMSKLFVGMGGKKTQEFSFLDLMPPDLKCKY